MIRYTYRLTNPSNVTLSAPFAVSDNKTTVTCLPAAQLAPGATLLCTGTYVITQADLDAGSVTNLATATAVFDGDPVTSNVADATVDAVQSPALTVEKSVTPGSFDAAGDTLTYEYLVTNTGNVTMTAPVTVNDDRATVTCPTDLLAPGETLTCTATYTVTQADLDHGSVTNTAAASSGGTVSLPDSATAVAETSSDLMLNKTAVVDATVVAPADRADAGDVITYTLTATNTGNQTLTGVSISDPMVTPLACTPPAPATLAPGEALVCTGTHVLTQGDVEAGSVPNTASASGTDPDNTEQTAEDVETTPLEPAPHLTVEKAADPATVVAAGDQITYTVTVLNDGNMTLGSPTVTDPLCALTYQSGDTDLDAELDVGEIWSYSCTYVVTEADVVAGAILNTVTVTAPDGTGAMTGGAAPRRVQRRIPAATAPPRPLCRSL